MKIRLFILLLLPIISLLSCAKDEPAPQVLKTSEHKLHFSGNGGSWLLTINSNAEWQISGHNDWCSINKTGGYNTDQVIVSVSANDAGKSRSTVLQLTSERRRISVAVEQDTFSGEYHYRLPVVFHIIYSDINDTTQNIKSEIINGLIAQCNQLYRNNINSIDMNMELVPATQTPKGDLLPEPGINRLLQSPLAYQDAEKFLDKTNQKDANLLWNPNEYVNVFIFTFTRKDLLGISHLAMTPRQNSLPGLEANNLYYSQLPNFPWGIALNNTHLYGADAYKTLAHELGHYLGLFHVFAETDCSKESDYCDDTHSYNRSEYTTWLSENGANLTEQEKYQRTSCEGVKFTSYNIMDYDYSYMDRFTADQFLRIRHVLEHSPLIPGPKNVTVTKGFVETEEPLIRIMK